ncbi:MAG: zinc ribbon domain-containing protein, partial [Candidatus Bathyarchaeia archaeon]
MVLLLTSTFIPTHIPVADAAVYLNWRLDVTENGEFITAFAHLYGTPQMERHNRSFCRVELDAKDADLPDSGIIEVSVGDYAQPVREAWEVTEKRVYSFSLNPAFTEKLATVTSPTPVTVDLKITGKDGVQRYADSRTIQLLPINYYAWVLGEADRRTLSPVLSTPHAEPIPRILGVAAKATPFNAMLGYQEQQGYSHYEVVDSQIRAVYNVLQSLGVTYVSSAAAFSSTRAQRVRLPVQTLTDRGGNCIETTLLFSSLLEALGLNVYYVFVTGHVFIAVDEWPDSEMVLPLETTMLGSGTYDEARRTGTEAYRNAKDDQSYLVVDVAEVRRAGITPTSYMDKMPEPARFYQELDRISEEINAVSEMLRRYRDLTSDGASTPQAAEERYRNAERLFNDGKYREAKIEAGEAISMVKPDGRPTPTPKPAFLTGESAETALGLAVITVPVILVVLAVVYARSRRRRVTPATPIMAPISARPATPPVPPAYVQPPPAQRFCLECGRQIPQAEHFCKYCGAK